MNLETRAYHWTSSINGRDQQQHPTREEAMARVERELSCAGEQFVAEYEVFKEQRVNNKFSMALEEAMKARVIDAGARSRVSADLSSGALRWLSSKLDRSPQTRKALRGSPGLARAG
jgi:hypothetical protein